MNLTDFISNILNKAYNINNSTVTQFNRHEASCFFCKRKN